MRRTLLPLQLLGLGGQTDFVSQSAVVLRRIDGLWCEQTRHGNENAKHSLFEREGNESVEFTGCVVCCLTRYAES